MTPQQTPSSDKEVIKQPLKINGLHIVANFTVSDSPLLTNSTSFKKFIDLCVEEFNLQKVGEVYHDFANGGYTAVICLTESHLSIHTWPELNVLTFDIFLSNYLKDNRSTTLAFYKAVKDYFKAEVTLEQIINR